MSFHLKPDERGASRLPTRPWREYVTTLGALLLVTLGLTACLARGAARDTPPTGAVAVRLERGPCHGRCPEYTVQLLDDGTVRFHGRRNVTSVGDHQGTIEASAVRALQRQFVDAGFASADSAFVEGAPGCGRYLPDGPSTVIAVRLGTTLTTVRHDAGCTGAPRFLQSLATRVDSVARTSAWIARTEDTNR